MKIKKSEIKTCKTAYLYHDGHLVLVHEKRDKDAGRVEWVTIYENIGIKTYFKEPGRLIISKEVLPFLSVAKRVDVRPKNYNNGSDNTRSRNIAVETISLYNGSDYGWHISNFPDVISSDIYFNDNDTSVFSAENCSWLGYPVKATYLEKAV